MCRKKSDRWAQYRNDSYVNVVQFDRKSIDILFERYQHISVLYQRLHNKNLVEYVPNHCDSKILMDKLVVKNLDLLTRIKIKRLFNNIHSNLPHLFVVLRNLSSSYPLFVSSLESWRRALFFGEDRIAVLLIITTTVKQILQWSWWIHFKWD